MCQFDEAFFRLDLELTTNVLWTLRICHESYNNNAAKNVPKSKQSHSLRISRIPPDRRFRLY